MGREIQTIEINTFAAMLHGQEVVERITTLAPSLNHQRITTTFMSQVAGSRSLQACSQESLLKALFTCCQWNLYPDAIAGDAYIVPFKGKATLIPGYRGLMKLVRRSGQIAKIDAWIVRDGEHFDVRYGTSPSISHVPVMGSTAPIVAAYAVAHLANGSMQFHVSDRVELDKAKNVSAAGKKDEGPWRDFKESMSRKTPIRMLCKLLPMGKDAEAAVAADEAYDLGKQPQMAELGPALEARVRVVDDKQLERQLTTAPEPQAGDWPPLQEPPKSQPVDNTTYAEPVPEPPAEMTELVDAEAEPPNVESAAHKIARKMFSKLDLKTQTEIRTTHEFGMFDEVRAMDDRRQSTVYAAVEAAAKEASGADH